FFTPAPPPAVHPLSLHDALPILPCHRVVHADGTMGFASQPERLRREGVRVVVRRAATARVDLRTRLWTPRLPVERRGVSTSSGRDRKSTRLNSSHRTISYAVFCL